MGVKRNLEGTNLNSENSFSALNNEEIISISELMGVHISDCDYFAIDLIKDLEDSKHSLDEKNKNPIPTPVDEDSKF